MRRRAVFGELRRLTGEAGLVTLGQLVSYAYPIVSIPLLSRVLGLDGLGIFIVTLAVIQILLVWTDFGFGFSALRRISVATTPEERQRVTSATITAKLALWVFGSVVLFVIAICVPSMRQHLDLYVVGLLMAVGAALYPMWYLQGTGRLKLYALLTGGSRLLAMVGLVLTVRSVDQIRLAVFWQFVPYLVCAVVAWVVLRRDRAVSLRLSRPAAARWALHDSLPLFFNLIGGQIIVNSSVILLGQLAGYRQVGLFGPADRLASAVHGVLVAVEQAMMPRVSAAHERPDEPHQRRLILGALVSSYAAAGLLLAVSAPIVIPLYLGDGFADAVPVVQLMGVATLISGITRTFTLDLVSAGRARVCSIVTAFGASWHLVTAALGAWTWGAVGVALAICATQLLMSVALGVAIVRGPRRSQAKPRRQLVAHQPASHEQAKEEDR